MKSRKIPYSCFDMIDKSGIFSDKSNSFVDKEQQLELIKRAQYGDKNAKEELILSNSRLVLLVIKNYINMENDIDDLIQEGLIALANAIDKFDISNGTNFSTYATVAIKSRITNYLRNTNIINIPAYQMTNIRRYKRTRNKLLNELGKEPSIQEISNYLELSLEKTMELYNLIANEPISLNDVIANGDGGDTEIGDLQEDVKVVSLLKEAEQESLEASILDLLLSSNLTDEEIIILMFRTGINTPMNIKLSLDEIGELFGITKEGVRQKETKAINKLYTNPKLLNYIEYVQNPDLIKRKISIKQEIQNRPFSLFYPDFYAFFPEYNEEELDKIILTLSKKDLLFIKELDSKNKELQKYHHKDEETLFKIINTIYDKLFKEYGRRPLITPNYVFLNINTKHPITTIKDNQDRLKTILLKINLMKISTSLRGEHNLYDRFPGYTVEEVNRSLIYISQEQYALFKEKYGNDFLSKCNGEANKLKKGELKLINEACKKMINVIEKIRNREPLFSNIYLYFSKYPTPLIDKVINELSPSEINILHKRFGPNLKEPYQEFELRRLSGRELSRLNEIEKKMAIKLEQKYALICVVSSELIPNTLKRTLSRN